MPIQQKLPPPVLPFSDFAGWDLDQFFGLLNFLTKEKLSLIRIFIKWGPIFLLPWEFHLMGTIFLFYQNSEKVF